MLPAVSKADGGKKCLVLDLDETLVHSSFKPVANPDFIIPVEIDNRITDVYVLKRPFVDEFLQAMGQKYEVRGTETETETEMENGRRPKRCNVVFPRER